MIRGFIANIGGASYFGVGSWDECVPEYDIRLDVANAAGVKVEDVTLTDAEELIVNQYEGVAFLTPDTGL